MDEWAPQCSLNDFLSASPDAWIVLDGGMGTELEKRGCDVNDPLWSGKTLLEAPENVEEVHLSYAKAGARCLVTSSYQITPESVQKHRGLPLQEGEALIRRSVQIARQARERFFLSTASSSTVPRSPFFIAGSVGPYGAYLADGSEYSGGYATLVDEPMMQAFHRGRIAALVAEGVDVIALETQAVWTEVLAVVKLVEAEFPGTPMWVSFTASAGTTAPFVAPPPRTSSTPPPCAETAAAAPEPQPPAPELFQLPDGTLFAHALTELEQHPAVIAIGINCVPLLSATPLLHHLRRYTSKPLVIYPNSGEIYDGETKTWRTPAHPLPSPSTTHNDPLPALPPSSHTLAGHARDWIAAGARLVGGCCRTTPTDITHLATTLNATR